MERTPNKNQLTKFTLEKKILLPFLLGLELATFRSRVRNGVCGYGKQLRNLSGKTYYGAEKGKERSQTLLNKWSGLIMTPNTSTLQPIKVPQINTPHENPEVAAMFASQAEAWQQAVRLVNSERNLQNKYM